MVGAIDINAAVQARMVVNGKAEKRLIDTGAVISMVSGKPDAVTKPRLIVVRTVSGFTLKVEGTAAHGIQVGDSVIKHTFVVSPDVCQPIFGVDFPNSVEAVINPK